MFSRANIYVANAKLEELCTTNENSRVKSGSWDDSGVFVYTTATHVKYLLPNGDGGIIRTLESNVYLTNIVDNTLCYLDREVNVGRLSIDNTEYLFKMALMKKKNREVF